MNAVTCSFCPEAAMPSPMIYRDFECEFSTEYTRMLCDACSEFYGASPEWIAEAISNTPLDCMPDWMSRDQIVAEELRYALR